MASHPLTLALALVPALARALRAVLVPVLALVLLVAGYRPARAAAQSSSALPGAAPAAAPTPAPAPAAAPMPTDWAGRPLDRLTVKELRLIAREAGHRALARAGRRADLLQVLQVQSSSALLAA